MTKRSLALVLAFAGAAGLLVLRQSVTQAQITNPQPTPAADELQSVTLVFGSKDMQPAEWNGSASISKGAIEINYMKHLSAVVFKRLRNLDRIGIVDSSRLFAPLRETNTLTLPQVNRGND